MTASGQQTDSVVPVRPTVVVDGSNISFVECNAAGQPQLANILLVRSALEERCFTPLIFVDAALKHMIDEPAVLNDLIQRQVPAGTDGDYWLLLAADQIGAAVVSNDLFRIYKQSSHGSMSDASRRW